MDQEQSASSYEVEDILQAVIKAINQAFGEVSGPHFILSFGNVICDSVALDYLIRRVINCVTGPGITVTGLADTARIDYLSSIS